MALFEYHMKKIFLLLLMIVSWGCSSPKTNQLPARFLKLKNLTVYPINAKPEDTISFKKDAVYSSTKKVLIGQMGSFSVDNLGRVFIADEQQNAIDVFKPDGRFLTSLGRHGRGPGEFSSIASLQIISNHLYIYDENQLRESVFTLHPLTLKNTILLAGNRDKYPSLKRAWPWINKLYVRNNNTYLAEFLSSVVSRNHGKMPKKWQNYNTKGMFYLLDKYGNLSSKQLFDFKNGTRTVWNHLGMNIFYFFGTSWTVLSGNNDIYQAEPGNFLIKVYSPDGSYLRAFYYPHPKIPLSKKSASQYGLPDKLINEMKFMKLPRNWPVITYMKIDNQNRLWIATTVKNINVYQWWVLKPSGRLIARFIWPKNKYIKVIKNGYIYTREWNKIKGITKIVRYRIEMKPIQNR